MSVSENMEFLTPGSVWTRDADGSVAKFLWITNTNLSAKTQAKHPPQVVYVDLQGNVYNRNVEEFFNIYSFHSVDGELEKRLESLLQFNAADYSAVQDPEDEPASPTAQELLQAVEELAPTAAPYSWSDGQRSLNVYFGLVAKEGGGVDPALTPQELSDALALYSQSPNREYSMTEHRLTFRLGGAVTIESLREAFAPSAEINTIDWFQVAADGKLDDVIWESWVGVYPEYSTQGLYAAVIVGVADAERVAPAEESVQQLNGGTSIVPARSITHVTADATDLTPQDLQGLVEKFQSVELDPLSKVSPDAVAALQDKFASVHVPAARIEERISALEAKVEESDTVIERLEKVAEESEPVPLNLWMTAAGIDPKTLMAALENDPAVRDALVRLNNEQAAKNEQEDESVTIVEPAFSADTAALLGSAPQ